MPEARELRSVIEAAEQAASAGDYVSAELNLRGGCRTSRNTARTLPSGSG